MKSVFMNLNEWTHPDIFRGMDLDGCNRILMSINQESVAAVIPNIYNKTHKYMYMR